MPLVVTTSKRGGPLVLRRAMALAERLGADFLPRERLARLEHRCPIYVVEEKAERLVYPGGRSFQAHPGMWVQKVAVGPEHPFLRALGPASDGSRLLDATAGLGQDSLHAAAFGWRVTALEKSPILAALLEGALRCAVRPGAAWADAASRVTVQTGDAPSFISACPSGAFDVIYFDPMFEVTRPAGPNYDLFRKEAHSTPLSADALRSAARTARHRVVVRAPAGRAPDLEPDPHFPQLGFNRRLAARAFDYWIVEPGDAPARWEPARLRRGIDLFPEPPGRPRRENGR